MKISFHFLNNRSHKKVLWVISVAVLIILTPIVIWGGAKSGFYNLSFGIGIAVCLWAFFIGGSMLLFLSPKMISTCFGSLLTLGADEFHSGAGLITAINTEVTKIAHALGFLCANNCNGPDPFIVTMIWLALGIIILLCIPVIFFDDRSS